MLTVHIALGVVIIVVCVISALLGFVAYRRAGTGGAFVSHALVLAQTLLIAQAAVGLVLVPWFYAPGTGPKRLLWFAATTLVAGALAVPACRSGS